MSRLRMPTAVLELKGSFKRHPERRRVDAPSTGPFGSPPDYFTDTQRESWDELANSAFWLTNADRWCAEVACLIMSRVREHGIGGEHGVKPAELAQLSQCQIRLGLPAAERSKVPYRAEGRDANPFEELDLEE